MDVSGGDQQGYVCFWGNCSLLMNQTQSVAFALLKRDFVILINLYFGGSEEHATGILVSLGM
jgi:hypothetical protein